MVGRPLEVYKQLTYPSAAILADWGLPRGCRHLEDKAYKVDVQEAYQDRLLLGPSLQGLLCCHLLADEGTVRRGLAC